MQTWTKPFVHNDRFFEAVFQKLPFREGLEASVYHQGKQLRVRELQFNQNSLLERLKSEIDKVLTRS